METALPLGARQGVVPSLKILNVPLFGTPCMFFNGKCVFPQYLLTLNTNQYTHILQARHLNVKVEENMRGWAHVPSRIGPANS